MKFHHYQFGLGQIFLADRMCRRHLDRQALVKDIGERLVRTVASSR